MNLDEKTTIFKNNLTNQAYTIFTGNFGNPSILLVETQFTRLFEQSEIIFSIQEKQEILS